MSEITAARFAESVRTTIEAITQFYGQIDQLNRMLKQALTSGTDRFTVLAEIPPQPANRKQEGRRIRFDYGNLYKVAEADFDEEIEEEDEAEDDLESGDDGQGSKKQKRYFELSQEQPVLLVRTIIFNQRAPAESVPQIVYTCLTDWQCGIERANTKSQRPLRLKGYMAKRIIRAVGPRMSTPVGGRITTTAGVIGRGGRGRQNVEQRLTAALCAPIRSIPLYDLHGSGAIEHLSDNIKRYWREHVTVTSGTA